MIARSTLAWSRLAALGVLAGLLLTFACRPAWSPDGRRLLYQSLIAPEELGVAVYDRATGRATLLTEEPLLDNLAALAWTADSATAVVITRQRGKQALQVLVQPVPRTAEPRRLEIAIESEAPDAFVVPPFVHGGHLFLHDGGVVRLDLATGAVERPALAKGRTMMVAPRGDGLCYLAMPKRDTEPGWEIGTFDPETFATEPLVTAGADAAWKPMPYPVFTRDLERIAMPACEVGSRDVQAILVCTDGKIETVLPLGDDKVVGIGSVHWAADDVTLLASLCRRSEDEPEIESWTLYEAQFAGSVHRETTILRAPRNKDDEAVGIMFPMALPPDGKTAAFTTALLQHVDPADHGLYLVDLTDEPRRTTRIDFPTAAGR